MPPPTRWPRAILHVDMDAFYASVEQRDQPEYQGKPVIVGADPKDGHGRGVVAAASYEARRYGLHSAMPIGEAYRRCPQGIYLRPRLPYYRQVSQRIRTHFQQVSELVEPISIDEAFLDVSSMQALAGTPEGMARALKHTIATEEQLPCTIGVASSKFVSKVASDKGKPDGLLVVPPGEEPAFLAPLPITTIPGIGLKTAARITTLGVHTIGDLLQHPEDVWESHLGARGASLRQLARGIDPRPVTPDVAPESISQETTFAQDTRDETLLQRTLLQLGDKVASRLREKQLQARTVTLKLRIADFTTFTRQQTLAHPTDSSRTILHAAQQLLELFLPLTQAVRLIGVGVQHVKEVVSTHQPGLFDATPAQPVLERTLDAIREKFGEGSIVRAVLLTQLPDEKSEA